jgi:hypothetical protein
VKTYQPYAPARSYLLPPSPSEWLPEGHLAYFILEFLEDIDLREIERVTSSRKIEKAAYDDVAFRVLAAGEHPHFTSINEFRATHRQALGNLFHQVLQECMSAGLVKLGHVAIDGTKMKANASKHKAMSYERMEKEDARLTQEIDAFFAQADATDAEEDKRNGVGQPQHDRPAELRRREDRRAKSWRSVRRSKETAKKRRARATNDGGRAASQGRGSGDTAGAAGWVRDDGGPA